MELHPGHNGVYVGDQKQAILQKLFCLVVRKVQLTTLCVAPLVFS